MWNNEFIFLTLLVLVGNVQCDEEIICSINNKTAVIKRFNHSLPLGFYEEEVEHCLIANLTSTLEQVTTLPENHSIKSFEVYLVKNFERWSLRNKYFHLPENISSIFPELIQYKVKYSKVRDIIKNNFQGLTKLEVLELENNKIVGIRRGVFGGLTSLIVLNLAGNEMEYIQKEAFVGLDKLEVLDLNTNSFLKISRTVFKGLTSLETLDLSTNSIETIDEKAFEDLKKLKTLKLGFNSLNDLKRGVFDNLISLVQLNLEQNYIKYIEEDTFASLLNLRTATFVHVRRSENCISKNFEGVEAMQELNSLVKTNCSGWWP
ncbi:CLUMA_CG016167, isoform A [Clunio marinus]|uniref:CLUMA_CG016167, isoform A n=1 Tax=Clunio marinus TaxID=568069 RepID=A0A1J1ITS2_9DIPT|nr:CLUMA_CG016167, isoform A [Clunio marinus]